MWKQFLRFTAWLTVLSIIPWLAIYAINAYRLAVLPQPVANYTLLFFIFLTLLSFLLSAYSLGKDRFTFVNTAYLVLAIRLLGTIFFIMIFLWKKQVYGKAFILSVFGLYIFYTVLEIYYLTTKLQPEINKDRAGNE